MSTTKQRLAHLERVWPPQSGATSRTETDTGHLKFWSRPLFPAEFRDFCTKRAEERYIATVRGGRSGSQSFIDPGWYTGGVTNDERAERIRFEYDELNRLIAWHGDEDGWHAWHNQAQDWPQQHGKLDDEALNRRLMHAWTTADGNRAYRTRPLWRLVWKEWKPNMTFDEHCDFDALLAKEGETRCRW